MADINGDIVISLCAEDNSAIRPLQTSAIENSDSSEEDEVYNRTTAVTYARSSGAESVEDSGIDRVPATPPAVGAYASVARDWSIGADDRPAPTDCSLFVAALNPAYARAGSDSDGGGGGHEVTELRVVGDGAASDDSDDEGDDRVDSPTASDHSADEISNIRAFTGQEVDSDEQNSAFNKITYGDSPPTVPEYQDSQPRSRLNCEDTATTVSNWLQSTVASSSSTDSVSLCSSDAVAALSGGVTATQPMRSSSHQMPDRGAAVSGDIELARVTPADARLRSSLRSSRRQRRPPRRAASDAGEFASAATAAAGAAVVSPASVDGLSPCLRAAELPHRLSAAAAASPEPRYRSRGPAGSTTGSTSSQLSSRSRRSDNLRVSFELGGSEESVAEDATPSDTPGTPPEPETYGNSTFYVSPPWNRLEGSEAGTAAASDTSSVDVAYTEPHQPGRRPSQHSGDTSEDGASSSGGSAAGDGAAAGDGGRLRRAARATRRHLRRLAGGGGRLVPSAADEARRQQRGLWTHNYSALMACITCTVGTGAVCRFALFGATYGVAFVIQFSVLSLVLGIPLMALHMVLGQHVGAGVCGLWRIAPFFKGVGIAAILAELYYSVYTVVPTAWMFVYLRDSFVSSYDRYKWATCPGGNCTNSYTETITYSVPQYLTDRVLNRNMSYTGVPEMGSLGFEISFNLAVLWILVYLSLGRGVRFYGKVVYAFVLLSVTSFIIVCIQLLSWTEGLSEFFTDRVLFDNVFWRRVPWVVAARETFFVWGLHGAALMAVASHNKYSHCVARDTSLVALVTLVVLYLSALFGYACLHALRVGDAGYIIGSSSFETEQRSRFLIAPGIGSSHSGGTPPEVKHYTNLVSGVIIRLGAPGTEDTQYWRSGYQVHRLATELFPSLLAVVGGNGISSFWALVFYLAIILFGIGQQLVVWHAVVGAALCGWPARLRRWELTVTFMMCVLGFGLSLPLMTQIGIHVIYFADFCVGAVWWIALIHALQLLAVLYVRGRPFDCAQLTTVLIGGDNSLARATRLLLSLSWHALAPALIALAVVAYQTDDFGAIFDWRADAGYGYWAPWVRQVGALLTLLPLTLVPLTALLQTVYTLTRHRRQMSLSQRMRRLFRPASSDEMLERPTASSAASSSEDEEEDAASEDAERADGAAPPAAAARQPRTRPVYTDPPPKYTPPPSYGTATGARIAKAIGASVRRSMRRLRQMAAGVSGPGAPSPAAAAVPAEPPPSYESVAVERTLRALPQPATWEPAQRRFSISDSVEALVAERRRGAAAAGHQRSVSLGLPEPGPPAAGEPTLRPAHRSLPRDLTPQQVRDLLRSGRRAAAPSPLLAAAARAAPLPLSRQQVRHVLRGSGTSSRSLRGENFELTGTVVEEVAEESAARHV